MILFKILILEGCGDSGIKIDTQIIDWIGIWAILPQIVKISALRRYRALAFQISIVLYPLPSIYDDTTVKSDIFKHQ